MNFGHVGAHSSMRLVYLVMFLQKVLMLLLNYQLLEGLRRLGQRRTLGTSQRPMARQLVDGSHAAGDASLRCDQRRLAVHGN